MKKNRQATEQYVVNLLNNSSLEQGNIDYWCDILPTMKEEQLRRLINILVLEKEQELSGFNYEHLMNYKDENI